MALGCASGPGQSLTALVEQEKERRRYPRSVTLWSVTLRTIVLKPSALERHEEALSFGAISGRSLPPSRMAGQNKCSDAGQRRFVGAAALCLL